MRDQVAGMPDAYQWPTASTPGQTYPVWWQAPACHIIRRSCGTLGGISPNLPMWYCNGTNNTPKKQQWLQHQPKQRHRQNTSIIAANSQLPPPSSPPPFRSPTPAPWQASSQAIRSLKMSHRRLPNVTAARLPRAAAAAADKPPRGPRCAGHPVAGHAHESHRCFSSRTLAAR